MFLKGKLNLRNLINNETKISRQGVKIMNIPKYVDKLIEKRMKLALELINVSSQLDDWLEKNEFDLIEMSDYTLTGCMIYCEPGAAASNVRRDILNK